MRNRPRVADRALELTVTWFGSGLLPGMPGTWGSLAALPFAWVIEEQNGRFVLGMAAVAVFLLGWVTSHLYAGRCGEADPGRVVIDEVAGQWLTLLATPPNVTGYIVGFVLFRIADITKPWPVSWADRRLKGGLGIMLDDVLAAGYAGGALYLFRVLTGLS
ncbi:MAG: phosphatidylglycerophosphatase A [Alphaproteobacteria bacterium]|nr:phosphatidylglycerophosphatase A [Alphaproteobacteria bacterium]